MDIKAAFASIRRGRLILTIRGTGMDRDLIRQSTTCLTDHVVDLIIEGHIIERHTVETDLPQLPLVSPILFALYTLGQV